VTQGEAVANRFEGKVVVITGGGAGIGRTYARRFATEGARVVIADLDADAADHVVKDLAGQGMAGLAVPMDVVDEDAAAQMVEAAITAFGGIDILVNNAGIHLHHARAPYTREGLAQWRRILDVNVIGALSCTVACRASMHERGGGAVVNQSSMAAYMGLGAYGVSKLALNALTVSLAGELAGQGIRVNGIAPGLVDSEAAMTSMSEEAQQQVLAGQAIKRLGRMDDLANMVLYLCSEEASFVTGQTFVVDGGHTRKPY
jgi:NAD(P)-dependent dehydrogenase (short-subunit alcohol dehydrogenase family)